MNRYGLMARDHWARWLPSRYATIRDPDSFFSAIGLEAARQIDDLTEELAGESQHGEDYLARAGRLTAARNQAEEIILPQQVLPAPEPGTDGKAEDSPVTAGSGRPAVISRSHPLWEEVNAEQEDLLAGDS